MGDDLSLFPGGIACVVGVVEVGLLATVVGVTALFGVVGIALITVVRAVGVAVLSSVVEGALLIAVVVRVPYVVPTGTGGMNEKE